MALQICKTAEIDLAKLGRQRVEIRGRVEPIRVFTAADPTVLGALVDPQQALALTEPESQVA